VALFCTATARPTRAAGVEPSKISLPKGPGSIEGLGRNFVPSLSSGTASFGVDIAVPPAPGGFAPKLSLEYDSGGGVSELGMGFRLAGLPSIRRRVERGLPRFDESDAFELSGFGIPSDLLVMPDGTFRPQYENGSFARVQRSRDRETWEARIKSGITFRFGGVGFTEEENGNVATYLLREQADLHGHQISYEWDTTEGYALLRRVTWNDVSADLRQELVLEYEPRPDVHELFSSGIRRVLARRVRSITVTLGGKLVRRYVLGYGDATHSVLQSVKLYGTDDKTALPELTLAYTEPSFAVGDQLVTVKNAPGRSSADKDVALADLNGDGLPDLFVTQAGRYQTYVNGDGTGFLPAQAWAAMDSPSFALSATGAQLADLDGDGAIDLVTKSGTSSFRFFPGKDATHFAPPVAIATVPNFTFEDPDVRLADMDGDRRSDVVITTAAGLAIGYNLGGRDWTLPEMIGRVDVREELRFSSGRVELCDVNGDRIQDLCVLRSRALVYWLGRGRGRFEPAREGRGVPEFDASDRFRLVDLDGDSWVDLVRVGVNAVQYALAEQAGEFGELQVLSDVPARGPETHVELADMNGSGTTDIVWIDVAGEPANAWRYLDLFPEGRRGLLEKIENGLGQVTRITYEPAAASAARAREAGQSWTARMNVAMPVVARIEVDSSLGDPVMVTEYRYRDGTWDPDERTFAGFAGGTETALGDEYTPTLVTESTFDTGLASRVLRGALLASESRDEAGKIFSRLTNMYAERSLGTATDGRAVEYAYRSSERVEHIERATASKARTTLTEWVQDDFGNATEERRWGEVRGDDVLIGNDEAIFLRTFANNTQDWILGYLASEETTDAAGTRVALKRFYYDGRPFEGLPLGDVARGDISRAEAWVGPKAHQFQLVSKSRYDAHGNPLEVRDGRGGARTYDWDDSGSWVLAESVGTGTRELVQRATYDALLGTIETFTDFNGSVTSYAYDPLGRLTDVVRPGDSRELPTRRYTYEVGAPLSRVITEYRLESSKPDVATSRELVDGLGRKRATLAEDDGGLWVLGDIAQLDARGNARRILYPRHVRSDAIKPSQLTEDAAGNSTFRDSLERVIRTESELGLLTRTEFLPFERRHWDGAQTTPEFGYEQTPVVETTDGLGRLIRVMRTLDGEPVEKAFEYNAAGNILSRRDPEGNITRFDYDGRGRLIAVDEPDAGKNQLVLDAEGDVLERHHPDGEITGYTYDLLGRPLTEDWDGDGEPEVVREYDSDPRTLGLLVHVTEPSGSTAFEYDERQRITSTTRIVQGETYVTGTRHDAQGRHVAHIYPDGSSVRIRRNARGFVSGFGEDLVRIHYEADGSEVRREYALGVVEQFGFDDDRRLDEHRASAPDGRLLQHLRWSLDGASNFTGIQDLRPKVSRERDLSARYVLDNLYRLTEASGTWGKTSWTYSLNGNPTSRASTVTAENAATLTYGKDAGPNALTGISSRALRYDARGRMLDDGERTYHWNGIDRLERVERTGGRTVESVFDAQGERRARVERGTDGKERTTHFIDAWSELEDGKLARYIVHQGRRIVRLSPENGTRETSSALSAAGDHGRLARGAEPAAARLARALPNVVLAVLVLVLLAGMLVRAFPAVGLVVRQTAWTGAALLILSCGNSESSTEGLSSGGAGGRDPSGNFAPGEVRTLTKADEILLYDHIGSLTEVVSARGEPVSSAALFPYGTERFDAGMREARRFADTPRDSAVGVDMMGARAYVPELGVWASPDPVLLDNPAEYVRSHPSHSAYVYGNSNPVSMRDPEGEVAWLAAGAVLVGITFTAKVLEQPQTRAELAAEMAKLSAQTYASLTGIRALVTAATAGVGAAYQFAANAVTGVAVGEVTSAVKEKVVHAATEVNTALGAAVDVGLELAPAVVGRAVEKKVSAAPKTSSLKSEKEWQAQYSRLGRGRSQQRLRQIAEDPNTSSTDRGWIKQEQNAIARGKRQTIRNPPGKQLAHTRGREAAKGYDHVESPSNLQDTDLHKTQHKYDNNGRSNPERP
jgi:RHS repeat-associated protein